MTYLLHNYFDWSEKLSLNIDNLQLFMLSIVILKLELTNPQSIILLNYITNLHEAIHSHIIIDNLHAHIFILKQR